MPKDKNLVWFNGKLVCEEKVNIRAIDPGFLYGYGLFETMRVYQGKVFALGEHLNRLYNSAKIINLNLNKKINFEKIIELVLKKNKFYQNARLRINAWQGQKDTCVLVSLKEYLPLPEGKYKTGFKTIIAKKICINEFSILSQIKSMNYLLYRLARSEAERNNAEEAIILNTKGFIADGSRSNIFLVKKNYLFTPSLESGCLLGIMRKIILELAKKQSIKTYEKNILPLEIFKVDEVFLTNSLIEIMPVYSCNNKLINKGKIGPVTQNLLKEYRKLTLK